MTPAQTINFLLREKNRLIPDKKTVTVFAPANIALCKYWGKRDTTLNLPMTSSLSISLPRGCHLTLSISETEKDCFYLNGQWLAPETNFARRLSDYLDLFFPEFVFHAEIQSDIPVGAGLASSACGFASVVLALDALFAWQLSRRELSLLARLGSGSASRSLWSGFVEWHVGERADGLDSYAEPLDTDWSDLCVGILLMSKAEKPVSSREAMARTVKTSALYPLWPEKVAQDLVAIKKAIKNKDIAQLGATAESNALTMHALMLSAVPAVCYFLPETIQMMHQLWALRATGLPVYFTQDAGPSLKLLFLADVADRVRMHFPTVEVLQPFAATV